MTSALAFSIALHTALGLVLAGLVWLVGSGCLALLRRPRDPRSLLDAYPLGLFVVMAAAVPPLLWRPLGVVSVVVVLAAVVIGARAARLPLRGGTLAIATLGSAAFGAGLGALLHGPTDELDSAAYGGMLWYVAKVVSAAHRSSRSATRSRKARRSSTPRRARASSARCSRGCRASTRSCSRPRPCRRSPRRPCASGSRSSCGDRPVPAPLVGIAAALLAVAIVPYPSWITETPPAAFALPLVVLGLARMARRARNALARRAEHGRRARLLPDEGGRDHGARLAARRRARRAPPLPTGLSTRRR